MGCSEMILKGFGFVAFFAGVIASSCKECHKTESRMDVSKERTGSISGTMKVPTLQSLNRFAWCRITAATEFLKVTNAEQRIELDTIPDSFPAVHVL
jgi:hypothetical protein